MLTCLSQYLAGYLVKKNSGSNDKLAVYQYGFEILLSTCFLIFTILVASVVFGAGIYGLVFLLCFMPLRLFSGGFHADSYFKCWIYTTLTACTVIIGTTALPADFLVPAAAVILVAAAVCIWNRAPAVHKNHRLSQRQVAQNRHRSRLLVSVLSAAVLAALFLGFQRIALCMSFSIGMAAFLLLIMPDRQTRPRNH